MNTNKTIKISVKTLRNFFIFYSFSLSKVIIAVGRLKQPRKTKQYGNF